LLVEAPETVTLTLTGTSNAAVGVNATPATVTIADNDVGSIAPTLRNNAWTIANGGTLSVTLTNLSATDPDTAVGTLVFTVGGVTNGYFELVAAPGVPVTTFTQQQIANGDVRFVHNGSGAAPSFTISVSDGTTGVGPTLASVTFVGAGAGTPAPGGGGGSPTVTSPPPVLPSTTIATTPTVAAPTTFLRTPTEPPVGGGGEERAEAAVVVIPSTAAAAEKRLVADTALPAVRAEAEVIETKPLRTEVEVEPVRAEMQVIPTRHSLDLDDEERSRIEVVLNSVRITGLALSVGAVWWAARAAGLVASLLASSPAWRHVDPLPVLGRDEEEEEDVFDVADEDKERRDEEHRAKWILEERDA
ncbi:MAG TPA: cadherin-like domain-containing protein, partial [Burkholderiales bacterium]|nr:cadherin-like domain-containing protein [Burkholderiales bacterium]